MRIVRHDSAALELRGRREDKEYGTGGLWLVWLVGVAFGAVPLVWLYFHRGAWAVSDAAIAIFAGGFGAAFLFFGIYRLLRREHLVLELNRRQGKYWTWSPWEGSQNKVEFTFDQVDSVSLISKVEVVVAGDDLPGAYNKWEARLRVRPSLVIRLVKSGNEGNVRAIADEVCKALGVTILDRTAGQHV